MPDPDPLVDLPLFQGLTTEQLSRVRPLLRHRTVPAGTNIITVEQPGELVYVILSGTAKIHVEQPDGRDVILAILGPGEVVGEMSVADRLARSATVKTLEDCRLLWMDHTRFRHCLQTIPEMTYNLVRILSRRLRLADAHIQSLAALDVYGRVARQILAFAQEYGQIAANGDIVVPLRLTQSDLADLVGASRVRVNQVLVDYRERGYISVDPNHHIAVHDRESLARLCT